MTVWSAVATFAGAGHLVCSLSSAAARLSVVALCVLYRKSSVMSLRAAAASPRSVAATNDSMSCAGVTVATTAAAALDSEGSAASEKGAAAEFTAAAAEAKVAARAEEEAGAAGVSACLLRSPRRSLRRSLAALLTLISVCVRCTAEIWLVLDPRVTAIWPSSAAFSGAASANSKGKRVIVIKERLGSRFGKLAEGVIFNANGRIGKVG